MARKLKKPIEVAKFGGVDNMGTTQVNGFDHDLSSVEAKSDTNLESDRGIGKPIVMRSFIFQINKEAFKVHVPTKQELFDAHVRGIELALWRDGLTFEKSHEPHILFNKKRTHYTIFVVAEASRGNVVTDATQTLSQIAHG